MSGAASISRRRSSSGKSCFPAALPTIFVGVRLGLIFALINIVGTEFLINFGGLGQLINDLAERYDLAGTYAAICFCHSGQRFVLHGAGKGRAMAETGRLKHRTPRPCRSSPVTLLRVAIILAVLAIWEFLAHSGWLYRDVVPSLLAIARAIADLLLPRRVSTTISASPPARSASRSLIGGGSGIAVGILLGANRFLAKAFEPYLYYLGPTPKIIFFPVMIMWFGVGRRIEDRARHAVVLLSGGAQRRRRHARRSTRC